MTNYSVYPIERLRWQVWIRRLRIEMHRDLLVQGDARGITTWAKMQRKLLSQYDQDATIGRLQGILGVVHRGNDPRRLMRRIREDDLKERAPEGATEVHRWPSGPKAPDHEKKKHRYFEIRTDLVAAGEKLCPGSADWENAYLWTLAYPVLPRLEELRATIAVLKRRMNLLSPSLDEYQYHMSRKKFEAHEHLSDHERVALYAASLAPLVNSPTANSLSLLAALVAESFIADQEVLLNLHRDAFKQGVDNLLADLLMEDIVQEFMNWIAATILATAWELPAIYHVSSLTEPFVDLDAWEKTVRGGRSCHAIILQSLGQKANPYGICSHPEDE